MNTIGFTDGRYTPILLRNKRERCDVNECCKFCFYGAVDDSSIVHDAGVGVFLRWVGVQTECGQHDAIRVCYLWHRHFTIHRSRL